MSYCVYKHTFPNNKIYIGITGNKPEHRWRSGWGYNNQPLMANAINKYGWNNIEHEILYDGLTKEEAERLEFNLIAEYQSNKREFGYNVDNGGSFNGRHSDETKRKIGDSTKGEKHPCYGKAMSEETKEKLRQVLTGRTYTDETIEKMGASKRKSVRCIETGVVYESINEAIKQIGIKGVSNACRGKKKTAGGYHWEFVGDVNYDSGTIRSVRCIETNKIYKSITEAYKDTSIPRRQISKACRGLAGSAGGYHWEYIEDLKDVKKIIFSEERIKSMQKNSTCKKAVKCIETGEVYESIKEAGRVSGIDWNNISQCCRGVRDTAKGFHWEYVDDELRKNANKKRMEREVERNKQYKPVRCIETGIVYRSLTEAGRQTGAERSSISNCCQGKQKTTAGFHWEFVK